MAHAPRWTRPPRRTALVTGASAGIGAAFARLLARRGLDLVLVARREDRLHALAAELRMGGAEVLVVPEDLASEGAADRMLAAVDHAGRTADVLINNAGYGLPGRYVFTSWAEQQAFLQLMLVSVCELTHKALPGMVERRYGRVVNVASLAGLVPGAAGAGTSPWRAGRRPGARPRGRAGGGRGGGSGGPRGPWVRGRRRPAGRGSWAWGAAPRPAC